MDRFQAINTFARVVETGSFVRAAERLGVSVSAVSRQVSELESHLDSRLLNRTTRRLSLTEIGRVFYERCVQLLSDLEEAEQSAGAGTVRPRGTLRLTCGTTFGERHLAGAIAEFLERYSEMRLDVELSDRTTDLVDEGFDAALRIGSIGSQNLVGRLVGRTRLVCCASPAYLARHGEPKTPESLSGHACLTYEYLPHKSVWPFRDPDGHDRAVRVAGPVNANHGNFLCAIAVAGAGIVLEPDFVVGPEVRAGRLKPILRKFEPQPASIYVVYPSRRHLSAKVRALAEFLSVRFANPAWSLDTPKATPRARKTGTTAS